MKNIMMPLMGARPALRSLLVRAGLAVLPSLGLAVCTTWAQDIPLNDTGITWSVDNTRLGTLEGTCVQPTAAGQDCNYGRDAVAAAGKLQKVGASTPSLGGVTNGFDYTKISNSGNPLPASAALGSGPNDWGCTRDNVTGLIWELKTSDGGQRDQRWSYSWYDPNGGPYGGTGTQNGGSCGASAGCDTYSYITMVNAQGLCGASDWRLPTFHELISISDFGQYAPAIDPGYFPNTPYTYVGGGGPQVVPIFWWSSSVYPIAYNAGSAWVVNSTTGASIGGDPKSDSGARVRLVRGGQPSAASPAQADFCVNNIPPSNPNSVYYVHSDGTVTDSRTHLMWQQCTNGKTGPDCSGQLMTINWYSTSGTYALKVASTSTFAGHNDWRLPSISELNTLLELCTSNPAINTDIFPNTLDSNPIISTDPPTASFFTNSPYYQNGTQDAWRVDFISGMDQFSTTSQGYGLVRLVRDDFDTIFANDFDH